MDKELTDAYIVECCLSDRIIYTEIKGFHDGKSLISMHNFNKLVEHNILEYNENPNYKTKIYYNKGVCFIDGNVFLKPKVILVYEIDMDTMMIPFRWGADALNDLGKDPNDYPNN